MAYSDLTPEWLTGLVEPPLVDVHGGFRLHPDVAKAFLALAEHAQSAGIELRLASAWRGFYHQARIWQAKWRDERPVYDAQSRRVAISTLSATDKAEAILLYSALPGTSRHHWGSDFDWYDAAAVTDDYRPQLMPDEYLHGPFQKAAAFIAQYGAQYGFFAPYDIYRGGVAAEPWHLSYMPLANACSAMIDPAMVQQALVNSDLDDTTALISLLPTLWSRYVKNIASPPLG